MKPIVLTGFGNERAFGATEPSFYFVFNDGELRVPCSEKAAEIVADFVYRGGVQQPVEPESQPAPSSDENFDEGDSGADDGVPSL